MRRDVELRSHAYRFHAPRGAESSSRRSLSPPFRPRALLRGVGALNVLDQCSARSPRSVLEMVGASFAKSVSGTLFPHRPRRTKLLVGAIEPPPGGAQTRPSSVFERRRQVGDPAPRVLPSPGAACAGGAPTRPRPRARAVRPARGNPWGRSGRLHAPEAARTGPVNALRRCSSRSPPGRWLNGHNGNFSCQPGRDHLGTSPGGYGSGFNGPRAVFLSLPTDSERAVVRRGGGATPTPSRSPSRGAI